jgi:hypothetical protein
MHGRVAHADRPAAAAPRGDHSPAINPFKRSNTPLKTSIPAASCPAPWSSATSGFWLMSCSTAAARATRPRSSTAPTQVGQSSVDRMKARPHSNNGATSPFTNKRRSHDRPGGQVRSQLRDALLRHLMIPTLTFTLSPQTHPPQRRCQAAGVRLGQRLKRSGPQIPAHAGGGAGGLARGIL